MPRPKQPTSPPENPFVIGHPASGLHFADRKTEVARIKAALTSPSDRLVVYGDRRLGKTSAIDAAAAAVQAAGGHAAVVDLAKVVTPESAAQRILASVHAAIGRRMKDVALALIGRMRPGTISVSASTDAAGAPSVSFSVSPASTTGDSAQLFTDVLDAVESELAARDLTMGLALDEFQRLVHWGGADIGWQLKSTLERHRHIGYVLAGSEKGLIDQLLQDKKSGLYKLADILDMGPVPGADMVEWIMSRGHATGLTINPDAATAVVSLAGPRTRDIVQLARALWTLRIGRGAADREHVQTALEQLVTEQGALHLQAWNRLANDTQRKILALVVHAPKIEVTSHATLSRYRLGPKSNVSRAVHDLIASEVLVRAADSSLLFDDPFFREYVRTKVGETFGFAEIR